MELNKFLENFQQDTTHTHNEIKYTWRPEGILEVQPLDSDNFIHINLSNILKTNTIEEVIKELEALAARFKISKE